MLGAERGDDWLAPVLTTAAIAQLVQGDHNIFENADNTLIDLRSFHHETGTGDLRHITIALCFDEISGCFQRRLKLHNRRFQLENEIPIRVCRHG